MKKPLGLIDSLGPVARLGKNTIISPLFKGKYRPPQSTFKEQKDDTSPDSNTNKKRKVSRSNSIDAKEVKIILSDRKKSAESQQQRNIPSRKSPSKTKRRKSSFGSDRNISTRNLSKRDLKNRNFHHNSVHSEVMAQE